MISINIAILSRTRTVHEIHRVEYGILINKTVCLEAYILKTVRATFLKLHVDIVLSP